MQDTLTRKDGYYSIEKNQWVGMEEDPVTEDDLAVSFKDNHPELLEKYGADASVDYTYYFSSSPPVMIIQSKGMEHYYDVYGNHLLDYDTEGKNAEELPSRTVLSMGNGMACLIIEWDTHMRHYSIYKNGCFFKELDPEEKGEIDGVYPHFYTKTTGNYLYIYNYQDQPCAKFLLGYYNKD